MGHNQQISYIAPSSSDYSELKFEAYRYHGNTRNESEVLGQVTGPAGDILTKECSHKHNRAQWNKKCMIPWRPSRPSSDATLMLLPILMITNVLLPV